MQIDIKTSSIEPIRGTFDHIARRTGADKPVSRYLEAMYDIQPTENFHYRPTWAPQFELYDAARTQVVMEDWYAFKDPRQFYYGTYTITRSRQQETVEKNFSFVEKRKLLDGLDKDWQARVRHVFLPLRHVEWGANMNNCQIADYGYGTALTQAAIFNTMDRLGIAQYISRVGLMLDGNTGESLDVAKQVWMEHEDWQPMRRLVEDSFVIEDWFELLVLQNFVFDGLLYPLIYKHFDERLSTHGGSALAMLTEFQSEWLNETTRWMNAVIKIAAAESDANRSLLEGWCREQEARVLEALQPIARAALDDEAEAVLATIVADFHTRAKKLGLSLEA